MAAYHHERWERIRSRMPNIRADLQREIWARIEADEWAKSVLGSMQNGGSIKDWWKKTTTTWRQNKAAAREDDQVARYLEASERIDKHRRAYNHYIKLVDPKAKLLRKPGKEIVRQPSEETLAPAVPSKQKFRKS